MGVAQISFRVVSENCWRLVFATRGVLIGDSGQVRVKQEQFSTCEFRQTFCECSKPGPLRKKCSENDKTITAAHEAVVEMVKFDDKDVFLHV